MLDPKIMRSSEAESPIGHSRSLSNDETSGEFDDSEPNNNI